ncbi:chorismate pyruvate-lyase family protein [Streptomyces sp. NPDC045369]|uniref:chorismate--pyruvate lyase family protein n=1 Tax=Streptomyces sp. NPDC045369 TaxID=3155732 RepID=UPI0033E65E33
MTVSPAGTLEGTATLPQSARLLMTTDGTLGPLVEAMVGEPITVAHCRQVPEPAERSVARELDVDPDDALLSRCVDLVGRHTKTLYIKAHSFWVPHRLPSPVRRRLTDTMDPIGAVLRDFRTETFRELLSWRWCDLPEDFPCRNLCQRTYRIVMSGSPAFLITERFTHACVGVTPPFWGHPK